MKMGVACVDRFVWIHRIQEGLCLRLTVQMLTATM